MGASKEYVTLFRCCKNTLNSKMYPTHLVEDLVQAFCVLIRGVAVYPQREVGGAHDVPPEALHLQQQHTRYMKYARTVWHELV